MIRFVFLLLIVFWALSLLGRALMWMLRTLVGPKQPRRVEGRETTSVAASTRLVRDPVCGVHVAENRALPLQSGGEIVHFCSAACRDQYVLGTKKYAANG